VVASEVLNPRGLAGAAADHGPAAAAVPVLATFARATSALIERRDLLRRYDRKLLLRSGEIPGLLAPLVGGYALLYGGQTTFSPYSTLYFDTADLRCWHDHRKGRRLRHKIRIRHYHDRKLTFLEVKSRRSDLVSFKHRRQLAFGVDTLGPDDLAFLGGYIGFPPEQLAPLVWIDYQRATLIGLDHTERLTIDLDVRCAPATDPTAVDTSLADVAFVELKQAPIKLTTPVMRIVRDRGLRATSISKYCTAVAGLGLAASRARFRAVLRATELP
jgi:hypothetical protein